MVHSSYYPIYLMRAPALKLGMWEPWNWWARHTERWKVILIPVIATATCNTCAIMIIHAKWARSSTDIWLSLFFRRYIRQQQGVQGATSPPGPPTAPIAEQAQAYLEQNVLSWINPKKYNQVGGIDIISILRNVCWFQVMVLVQSWNVHAEMKLAWTYIFFLTHSGLLQWKRASLLCRCWYFLWKKEYLGITLEEEFYAEKSLYFKSNQLWILNLFLSLTII